ncbi:MAG: hypothetical protein EP330_00760 [Deltaproteobacteria bacterium]|nr:MAG: hypothetical protein EP330_00760 [Deltaproteobacteria bacterium]
MRILALTLPLVLAACGTTADDCVEDEYSCDGNILMQCVGGELVEDTNCDDVGLTCHAEMGHCMDMSDSGM